jgi:hypothetical protein
MAGEQQEHAKGPAKGGAEAKAALKLQALELRQRGFSYRRIAAEIGRSVAAAHNFVRESLEELAADQKREAGKLVALELARLDKLAAAIWPKANCGDVQAIDRLLKILERRAKYLGLDQPEKLTLEATGLEGVLTLIEEARTQRSAPVPRLSLPGAN